MPPRNEFIRTRAGRIVYRRRPHLFRYRDVLRIVRVVRPKNLTPSDLESLKSDIPEIFATILAAEADLFEALGARGWEIWPEQELTGFLLAAISKLIEMATKSGIGALVLQLFMPPEPPVSAAEVVQSAGVGP